MSFASSVDHITDVVVDLVGTEQRRGVKLAHAISNLVGLKVIRMINWVRAATTAVHYISGAAYA